MSLLSILIGTRNRIEVLPRCLDAIAASVTVPHETIVIDAGSTDGTLAHLRSRSDVQLVCDGESIGQAQSLNRVAKRLDSKYVCWLSDDNVAQPGALDLAVSILEQNDDIGMVALKVKDVTGPYADKAYLGAIWPSGVLNCNQGLLRTELLRRLGGFDEQLRDYGIDADLTTKVLLEGFKVVYTKRVAVHHYRGEGESWIGSEGRKQRLLAAKDLYGRRYAALIRSKAEPECRMYSWLSSRLLRRVQVLYRCARDAGIPFGKVLGYAEKDWINALRSRFISNRDLIVSLRKPYYLVQSIPLRLRRLYQQRIYCPLEVTAR